MAFVFLKPAPGRKVRDPVTRLHLPDSGKRVQISTYWTRRLADGDVVEVNQISDSRPGKGESK